MKPAILAVIIGVFSVGGAIGAPVVVTLGGTFYEGAPQYEILADDQVVGIGTVSAKTGDVARFEVGNAKRLAIRFVNDLAGPKDKDGLRPEGTDRNLIIEAVEYQGEKWLGRQLVGPRGVTKSGEFAVVAINQTVPVFDASPAAQACDGVEIHLTGFANGKLLPNEAVLSGLDQVIQSDGCSALITGYSSMGGAADKNREISVKRARAVLDYLESKGAKFSAVEAEGRGATDQFGPDEDDNRRVVVSLRP